MFYSRLSFLALLLFLVAFVSALPIYEDGARLVARVQPESSSNKKDWPKKSKLREILKSDKHQATFWSGRRGGTSTQQVAETHTQGRNGKTLEMALHQGGAKMPPWSPGNKKVEQKWTQAAKIFAKKAQGDVHAHIGETVRPNGVYDKTEKPALLKNKKVNTITEHRHDGSQTVIPGGKQKPSRLAGIFGKKA
jgi:hypothetical protein